MKKWMNVVVIQYFKPSSPIHAHLFALCESQIPLYSFPRVVTTKYDRLGGFKRKLILSQLWRLGVWNQVLAGSSTLQDPWENPSLTALAIHHWASLAVSCTTPVSASLTFHGHLPSMPLLLFSKGHQSDWVRAHPTPVWPSPKLHLSYVGEDPTSRDFPGAPVAKTLHSQSKGPRLDPWSGNQHTCCRN